MNLLIYEGGLNRNNECAMITLLDALAFDARTGMYALLGVVINGFVRDTDEKDLVTIIDAHETLGEGFKRRCN